MPLHFLSNEVIWLIMLAVNFACILAMYRFFGKTGLYSWICIGTIIANIQVLKIVNLAGVTATLGNITYATLFLATDILSENHGQKAAFTGTVLGFCSMIAMTIIMPIVLSFQPAEADWAQSHLEAIFSIVPRITAGSLIAYAISQCSDVRLYHLIRRKLPADKWLWIRNNGSTLISQFLDTIIFTTIAFGGMYEKRVFVSIVLTTYLFKAIVALLDTPCLYLAKRLPHPDA